MKRYEGLFILNPSAKEDGVKEAIDKVTAEITAAGGRVETTQKMDKKQFARVADKKFTSGFYLNVIFQTPSDALTALHHRFELIDEVFRVVFTVAPEPKPAALPVAGVVR